MTCSARSAQLTADHPDGGACCARQPNAWPAHEVAAEVVHVAAAAFWREHADNLNSFSYNQGRAQGLGRHKITPRPLPRVCWLPRRRSVEVRAVPPELFSPSVPVFAAVSGQVLQKCSVGSQAAHAWLNVRGPPLASHSHCSSDTTAEGRSWPSGRVRSMLSHKVRGPNAPALENFV